MAAPQSNGPLVSIGMPAYNGERYIRKAIDSLLAQDYANFELLVSDNASTDATQSICREYAALDRRVRVQVQSRNIGVNGNFYAVLDAAQGEYFMWAAVDDYWHQAFISEMVRELEQHPEAGVAMSAVDRVWENGDLLDTIRFTDRDNPNHRTHYQMLKSITAPIPMKHNLFIYGLFRTHFLREAVHAMPEVPGADRLFVCQIALATKFRYVDTVLHVRLQHGVPSTVRHPEEKFNKMRTEDRWVDVKVLHAMASMFAHSTVIPWHRKLYLPVALWRYGWLLAFSRLIPAVKKRIAPDRWERLRNVLRIGRR